MPANFLSNTVLYLIVTLGLFPGVIVGQAVAQTPPADEPYSLSYAAGGNDAQGNFLGGTEFMHVVAFNGMLYGGLSYWEDVPGNDPNSHAQIIVLNSYNGQWQQEWLFYHPASKGDVSATRVNSLDVVTFHSYDASGNVTGTYPPILAASLDTGFVFTQQSPGKWVNTLLPSSQGVRSTATHLIPGDTTETFFAGVGTKNAPGTVSSVYNGTYDPSVPGQISWNQQPEILAPQGGRVMSMVDCDGYLFAAVNPYIYRRNDQTNSWEQFFTYETANNNPDGSGFRALTCTNLSGGQLALMTGLEGPAGYIFTIDPQTGAGSIVVDTRKSLTKQWGGAPLAGLITGYDYEDVTPVTSGPDTFQLTGLSTESPIANEQNAAWFLSCELNDYGCDFNSAQSTSQPPYWLFEVPALPWPYSRSDTALRSIRTIAVSPFPEDQGQVMYLGGYDARNEPAHNTAWLYRVGIDYALGR